MSERKRKLVLKDEEIPRTKVRGIKQSDLKKKGKTGALDRGITAIRRRSRGALR